MWSEWVYTKTQYITAFVEKCNTWWEQWIETVASTNQTTSEAATPSTEHPSASHKSSSDYVSVTLYGPKGYFNTYAMLDTGSTCSLLATDVAKNLGLDGPMESVRLNGIQNVPELIVPLETRCGPKGCPVGVRTKLGWTVTGRLPGYIEDGESVYKVHIATPDEVLHETVKRWWRTENFECRYDYDVQRLTKLLFHQRIKLPSVFCGANQRSLK